MCAAAVLRSQDCLPKHYGPRRKLAHFNPTNNNYNTSAFRSCRRKRSPTRIENTVHDRYRDGNPDRKSASPPLSGGLSLRSNLVMGQVKILKRGEALPDFSDNNKPDLDLAPASTPSPTTFKMLGFGDRRNEDELILCSTGRLGPDPETVQMEIRASDFYAGSGPIVASPPPSSLPLPAFFCKEKRKIDAATNDLLRLLRLD